MRKEYNMNMHACSRSRANVKVIEFFRKPGEAARKRRGDD
jgi:hypothetical protein